MSLLKRGISSGAPIYAVTCLFLYQGKSFKIKIAKKVELEILRETL